MCYLVELQLQRVNMSSFLSWFIRVYVAVRLNYTSAVAIQVYGVRGQTNHVLSGSGFDIHRYVEL
jgi:hypothetical protein